MNEKQKMLSPELQVACEIYKHNIENKPIWFSKLCERFKNDYDKSKVVSSIHTLSDWRILRYDYGETKRGMVGVIFTIDNYAIERISELYEIYYKE